jgi:hypothetical protein
MPTINQGSHIRIYNAEKKWTIHKDITCKKLRWTVSDIALSPDQRYLVRLLCIVLILSFLLCAVYSLTSSELTLFRITYMIPFFVNKNSHQCA